MKKIYLAGHQGMVGSAILRQLLKEQEVQVVTRSRAELDLCDQKAVQHFFENEQPNEVILAAAKVGGIHANNTYPADFIFQNLQIQSNVINSAHLNDVQKLLFLGSSCIYPKLIKQPMQETALLTGPLEPTNEPYAIAKIAGIKMCESYNRQYRRDYRSVMPTNLYGPGDNYHPENSHVVPALIRRFHEAKKNNSPEVTVWGSGSQMREFLFVDDMATASLFIHNLDNKVYQKHTRVMLSHINIGTGSDITIRELAETIKEIVGFTGKVIFDTSKQTELPKLMDTTLMRKLGLTSLIDLYTGLEKSYSDFLQNNSMTK